MHHLNGHHDPREDGRPADEPASLLAFITDVVLWAFLVAATAVGAVWLAGQVLWALLCWWGE